MKPFFMIFIGPSYPNHVETGKMYKIVRKEREQPLYKGGPHWYTYIFIDDIGNFEPAASKLFLRPKRNPYKRAP